MQTIASRVASQNIIEHLIISLRNILLTYLSYLLMQKVVSNIIRFKMEATLFENICASFHFDGSVLQSNMARK